MIKRQSKKVLTSGTIVRSLNVTTAADTATVVTIGAYPGAYNYLHGLQWSYDAAPTGGKITVQDGAGGAILWEQAITGAGAGGQDPDVLGSENTALVITMAAGGAGIVGRIAGARAYRVNASTLDI
jgi:hypothetical protein